MWNESLSCSPARQYLKSRNPYSNSRLGELWCWRFRRRSFPHQHRGKARVSFKMVLEMLQLQYLCLIVNVSIQLVTGKEKQYLKHFYDRASYNASGTPPDELDHYAIMYVWSGARRAAFSLYESFKLAADENVKCVMEKGKCKVAALGLEGHLVHSTGYGKHAVEDVWGLQYGSGTGFWTLDCGKYKTTPTPHPSWWVSIRGVDRF